MRSELDPGVNVVITVTDAKTGNVIEEIRTHNLVVTAGRNLLRDLIYGDTVTGMTHFGLGIGTQPISAARTSLAINSDIEVFRDVWTTRAKPADATVGFTYYLDSSSANGNTLTAAAMFSQASGGTMYAIVNFTPIVKTSSISVTFAWSLTWSVP
jgi:hypothetical protein